MNLSLDEFIVWFCICSAGVLASVSLYSVSMVGPMWYNLASNCIAIFLLIIGAVVFNSRFMRGNDEE